jgi:hypothetical protein
MIRRDDEEEKKEEEKEGIRGGFYSPGQLLPITICSPGWDNQR